MILTITLVLSVLVAFNFLLLIFSCNKTTRKAKPTKDKVFKANPTLQRTSNHLAPTGS